MAGKLKQFGARQKLGGKWWENPPIWDTIRTVKESGLLIFLKNRRHTAAKTEVFRWLSPQCLCAVSLHTALNLLLHVCVNNVLGGFTHVTRFLQKVVNTMNHRGTLPYLSGLAFNYSLSSNPEYIQQEILSFSLPLGKCLPGSTDLQKCSRFLAFLQILSFLNWNGVSSCLLKHLGILDQNDCCKIGILFTKLHFFRPDKAVTNKYTPNFVLHQLSWQHNDY